MIEINVMLIAAIAKWIVAVAGGAAVLIGIIKKMVNPIVKPVKEMMEKQIELEEYLKKDKERLDKHEELIETLSKDSEMSLKALKLIINHLRTNNNTGAMEEVENQMDEYLINRK